MSKPLTIDELKALEVGDWVWIIDNDRKGYAQVEVSKAIGDKGFIMPNKRSYGFGYYDTYGTKWLAYKNKEMAECKGEIVELPCIRPIVFEGGNGVTMYELAYFDEDGMVQTKVYRDDQLHEAERRLAELRGAK